METRSLDDLDSLLNALGSLVALSLAIYLAGYVKHLLHDIVRGLRSRRLVAWSHAVYACGQRCPLRACSPVAMAVPLPLRVLSGRDGWVRSGMITVPMSSGSVPGRCRASMPEHL